jgi:tetratricopeptide (TPR) repeat protein
MYQLILSIVLLSLLAACRSDPGAGASVPLPVKEAFLPEQSPAEESFQQDFEVEFARQRLIGDLLYDALVALDKDRLLSPVDDNAYGRYQRVLAYDPDNWLARQGLKNIVDRYLQLAGEASRQGRFEAALSYLERARFVDEHDPAIVEAWLVLQAEMQSGDLVFILDAAELRTRAAGVQSRLADIAGQARQHDAFVLITAPNDDQARWMFTAMRDAVEGYRLRGNIEIGSTAVVRLRIAAKPGS